MVTAGLSGGIASGKTTVVELFRELGAEIIDADTLAREIVEPGREGFERIRQVFGPGMLTARGRLDRARLAAHVFGDAAELQRLNAVLHPLVKSGIHTRIARLSREGFGGTVVVDVPLLFECGWQAMFARTILVYCSPGQQLRRLMRRNGLDRSQADARIAAQMPLREKKKLADFVIDNQGSRQGLRSAVAAVYGRLLLLQ